MARRRKEIPYQADQVQKMKLDIIVLPKKGLCCMFRRILEGKMMGDRSQEGSKLRMLDKYVEENEIATD